MNWEPKGVVEEGMTVAWIDSLTKDPEPVGGWTDPPGHCHVSRGRFSAEPPWASRAITGLEEMCQTGGDGSVT